jgi:threonine/homoserine/homoserine lactone efflux protein
MSIAGLLSGFIFSMPIAGPISILITSNALKGRLSYCNRVNLGASFADFTYVFIAVYGLTNDYPLYIFIWIDFAHLPGIQNFQNKGRY